MIFDAYGRPVRRGMGFVRTVVPEPSPRRQGLVLADAVGSVALPLDSDDDPEEDRISRITEEIS